MFKVLLGDLPIFVSIYYLECFSDVLFVYQGFTIQTSRYELLKVYDPVTIHIARLYNFFPVILRHVFELLAEVGFCDVLELLDGESAAVVFVKAEEFSLELL